MKKLIGVIVAVVVLFLPVMALAAPTSPHLNWGTELNQGECEQGTLVINVSDKITDNPDSGEAGNIWALDNVNRQIQVREVSVDTFCVVVQYQGKFVTVAGRSPGDTDNIGAGITGNMHGGYRVTITGTLKSDLPRTRGNIGSFEYDPAVSEFFIRSWANKYFENGWTYSFAYWGWIYRAGKNGTWVNASTGNEGDITD